MSSSSLLASVVLPLLPINVLADYTSCNPEGGGGERKKAAVLIYKLAALIASILIGGAIGVCLSMVGKRVQASSSDTGGMILSTGFIHVLPADAFESLTWGDFRFSGFIAMLAAMYTLVVETYSTSFYNMDTMGGAYVEGATDLEGLVQVDTHDTHGHARGALFSVEFRETELLRHRVISQVLELGRLVHFVIIGIASENPKTIIPLIAALTSHQFFGGT